MRQLHADVGPTSSIAKHRQRHRPTPRRTKKHDDDKST
jgi:hypothetical protein